MRGSRPSRVAAFMFAASAVVGVFPPLFWSHTWCVYFRRPEHYSLVFYSILNKLSPPACRWRCRGHLCTCFFVWGSEPTLGRPHRFPLAQEGLGILVAYYTYQSYAFLCVHCEYFVFYARFSLIVSPLLPPSLFIFSVRSDRFLGVL